MLPSASDDAIKMLYGKTRCGLFHSGFTEDRVYLSHNNPQAMELTYEEELSINPTHFVQIVLDDFEAYIQDLRANPGGELAQQFEKLWNERWENS